MLLIFIIFFMIFNTELLISLIPVKVRRKNKKLKLKIYHKNGEKENIQICFYKDRSQKYRIMSENDAFIETDNNKLYICHPQKDILRACKYYIGNETYVKIRKIKPRFFFTLFSLILFAIITITAKQYIKNKIIPEFTGSSQNVILTHNYAEFIDYNSYKGVTNFLIVGSDAREDMNTPHADVMMLVSLNKNNNKINICSISRDIYVSMQDRSAVTITDIDPDLPNYKYLTDYTKQTQWFKTKLNYAVNLHDPDDPNKDLYSAGLNALVNVIEYNLAVPVDGVINISWSDFISIIDALNGVEIDITDEMLNTVSDDYHEYGIIPVINHQNSLFGKEDSFSTSGIQHLNGNQALAYVRTRYIAGSNNTDLERTGRIRNFMLQLLSQKKTEIFGLTGKTIASGMYSSISEEQIYNAVKFLFSRFPTFENAGRIPYSFHDFMIEGQAYIGVDGINEDLLDVQARNTLLSN